MIQINRQRLTYAESSNVFDINTDPSYFLSIETAIKGIKKEENTEIDTVQKEFLKKVWPQTLWCLTILLLIKQIKIYTRYIIQTVLLIFIVKFKTSQPWYDPTIFRWYMLKFEPNALFSLQIALIPLLDISVSL